MPFPHFDREETISEDIGFRGPHFDFNERITDTRTPSLAWSPQGEFGQHGEFEGWRSAEDPPSYRSDWQDYPADEFTGIETIRPNKFGAPRRRGALRGIPSSATSGNRRGPGPWNDFSMGMEPWPMDDDMMDEIELAKIYQSGDPGMINKGSWGSFMPGGDPFWDEVSPQGEAINQILQDPLLQKTIQGLIQSGETDPNVFRQYIRPDILEQLPPGAFTTINDFTNQQPITVI